MTLASRIFYVRRLGMMSWPLIVSALLVSVAGTFQVRASEMTMPPAELQSASRLAALEDVRGLWSLRATDGDQRCRIALSTHRSGTLHEATVETCDIDRLKSVRGWRPIVGGFELIGQDNAGRGRFRLTGLDTFEAVDGSLRGQRAAEF